MSDVTRILGAIEAGNLQAADELLPLVYDELRKLAAQRMAQESPDHTLQATAIVHEAYLRLVGSPQGRNWDDRRHFFAAAAEAMRRILIEHARRKQSGKHGGDRQRVELDVACLAEDASADDLLDLDEALARLADQHPTTAELVKLRCFAGLSVEQAAKILDIRVRTAYRDWAFARAWLHRALIATSADSNPKTK